MKGLIVWTVPCFFFDLQPASEPSHDGNPLWTLKIKKMLHGTPAETAPACNPFTQEPRTRGLIWQFGAVTQSKCFLCCIGSESVFMWKLKDWHSKSLWTTLSHRVTERLLSFWSERICSIYLSPKSAYQRPTSSQFNIKAQQHPKHLRQRSSQAIQHPEVDGAFNPSKSVQKKWSHMTEDILNNLLN